MNLKISILEVQVANTSNGQAFDFRTIGIVPAKGNSSITNQYEYVDTTPNKTGNRYYRIKQVDIDGTTTYTDIRQLRFNESITTFSAYPNPVRDDLFIHYEAEQEEDVNFQLVDMTGRILHTQPMHFVEGNHDFRFDLGTNLPEGFYSIQIIRPNNKSQSFRINKIRD